MIKTVTSDLETFTNKAGKPTMVLVTGATGYIGGRLIRELLSHNYRVRVLVRDAKRISDYPWQANVEVVEGDATDPAVIAKALNKVDLAYYLLHALMVSKDFEAKERELA